jgi:hypothetical protein
MKSVTEERLLAVTEYYKAIKFSKQHLKLPDHILNMIF